MFYYVRDGLIRVGMIEQLYIRSSDQHYPLPFVPKQQSMVYCLIFDDISLPPSLPLSLSLSLSLPPPLPLPFYISPPPSSLPHSRTALVSRTAPLQIVVTVRVRWVAVMKTSTSKFRETVNISNIPNTFPH